MTPRPRGAWPTPRHLLMGAMPHRIVGPTPAQWLWLPARLSMWLNNLKGNCVEAEECFAKACHSPEIFISDATAEYWGARHNVLNGAYLTNVMDMMQGGGFLQNKVRYNDGPYTAVNWNDAALLRNAIWKGPVKLGVSGDPLESVVPDPPRNGWFATGLKPGPQDHCVSLCGYGTIDWLAKKLGTSVLPRTINVTDPAYALFTWSSVGIITVDSLLAITGEAWLRSPSTIILPS